MTRTIDPPRPAEPRAKHSSGDPWEWVYIDLVYEDETFGYSQPMPRLQAQINMQQGLAVGRLVDGKRVVQATIVALDPQPTVMLPVAVGGIA